MKGNLTISKKRALALGAVWLLTLFLSWSRGLWEGIEAVANGEAPAAALAGMRVLNDSSIEMTRHPER